MSKFKTLCVVMLLLLTAASLQAVVYQVPSDDALVNRADVIVVATISGVETRVRASGMIETIYGLQVERTLKGAISSENAAVVMPGGVAGGRFVTIPGGPKFTVGEHYLFFLDRRSDGSLTTSGLAIGAFRYAKSREGTDVLVRDIDAVVAADGRSLAEHRELLRSAPLFERYVAAVERGSSPAANYFVTSTVVSDSVSASGIGTHASPTDYLVNLDTKPAKWFDTSNIVFMPNTTSNAAAMSTANTAASAWSTPTGGNLNISISTTASSYTPFTGNPADDDGKNSIVFNASSGTDFPGTDNGVIAFAGLYGDVGDATYNKITEADIFIGSLSGGVFEQAVAHEMGHGLGFRHSNVAAPSDSNAVMQSVISGAYGTNLQCWDLDAVRAVYGGSGSCVAPTITQQPQGDTVPYNGSAIVSVSASGCGNSYQWYKGSSGDTSQPIAGATSASISTPSLKQTTDVWVRVTNACGSTNSATATITVQACQQPTATPTATSVSIASGGSTTLTVNVTGSSPFTFQWYKGSSGDTSMPIAGATSSQYFTGPLTQSQTYWMRAQNDCGVADGATITVNVGASCPPVVITTQPANVTINAGQTATLSVSASGGSLTYQWYQGGRGDTSRPAPNGTGATLTTPALNANETFWVRVTNSCGATADSNAALVTVQGAPCELPTIVAQPQSASVGIGRSATLTVDVRGTVPFTFQWFEGNSGNTSKPVAGATQPSFTTPEVLTSTSYWVRVTNRCGSVDSSAATITAVCAAPPAPVAIGPGEVLKNTSYTIMWRPIVGASSYQIQEATSADFVGAVSRTVTTPGASFVHDVAVATRYYYRVRGVAQCNGAEGAFSPTVEVVVNVPPSANDLQPNVAVPEGSTTPITMTYLLKPPPTGKMSALNTTFTATTGQPWMTVSPSAGTIAPTGTTLSITVPNPSVLPTGTNTGTVSITTGGTTTNVPVSVSVVTPITPLPKSGGADKALIIPVVGHLDGANGSKFLSDVRITNNGSAKITYELSYTPTGVNGSVSGKKTLMSIDSGDTKALNDVVKNWFGLGATGESAVGVMEIRPLSTADGSAIQEKTTVASSRTYNVTSAGTFGQFIPAISLSQFIKKGSSSASPRISLQQISDTLTPTGYRTNFGIVEGAGEGATVVISIFDATGSKLREVNLTLAPFEHRQWRILQTEGLPLADGRIEVQVTSPTGKVTAYASVVDGRTNDPLLVSPVIVDSSVTNKYVVPGVANTDSATNNWRSDVRLFNSSNASVTATLIFVPQQGSPASCSQETTTVSVPPNGVVALNNVLASRFTRAANCGGALQVITPSNAPLIVSARTYDDQRDKGTYGQFIPAVTPADAIGLGDRPLTVLQLEESDRFRSNLGLVEVTGKDVIVRVTAYDAQSKVSVFKTYGIPANSFVQVGRILDNDFRLKPTYNAVVSVEVVGGEGRVSSYASIIDNATQDPTYVPAQ